MYMTKAIYSKVKTPVSKSASITAQSVGMLDEPEGDILLPQQALETSGFNETIQMVRKNTHKTKEDYSFFKKCHLCSNITWKEKTMWHKSTTCETFNRLLVWFKIYNLYFSFQYKYKFQTTLIIIIIIISVLPEKKNKEKKLGNINLL